MMLSSVRQCFTRLQFNGARCCTVATALGVEALLRRRSLPQTCRLLGIHLGVGEPPTFVGLPFVKARINQVRQEVDWVYTRLSLPDTCLRRSLTAGFRLRAYQPRLVIGVKKTSTLDAHAWLVARGVTVDWAEKHDEYAPIC